MEYHIIGGDTKDEIVHFFTIGCLIELANKYQKKVFRFLDTDYYPEDLNSWRGSYNLPSVDYGHIPITGLNLAKSLSIGLAHEHTGWKGGEYTYELTDEFYVARNGCAEEYKVVGYENKDNEIILLTRIDRY